MTRPLIPKNQTKAQKAKFHREVFILYGHKCFFCGHKATDAAHIIRAAQLGPKVAYIDARLARPACRPCHERENVGEICFPPEAYEAARLVANLYLKSPIQGTRFG